MRLTTTTVLAQALVQEEKALFYAQQAAITAGLPFHVPGNIFTHLLGLKYQSEDRYLTSLQRREILRSRLEANRRKLAELNKLYGHLRGNKQA